MKKLLILSFLALFLSGCDVKYQGTYQSKEDFKYLIYIKQDTVTTPEHVYAYKLKGLDVDLSDDEGKFHQCRIDEFSSSEITLTDGNDKNCPLKGTYVKISDNT